MLVFDRPSFSPPFTLAFCSSVHYIASPFHLIQLHKCLDARCKSRGYARYSPPLAFPSLFYIHSCCNQTLEPRSRSTPEVPTMTWRSSRTSSSLEVPRQEVSPFRLSCCYLC